jgi:hypothetical protein
LLHFPPFTGNEKLVCSPSSHRRTPPQKKPRLNSYVAASLSLAPYFPPHTQRNVYLSLLHLSDDAGANEKAPKVPDSILRAALLARAQEDITRIIEIRTRKQALSTLLQRGVVGDEIWQRLLRAEQELELEVKDVVQEVWFLFPDARNLIAARGVFGGGEKPMTSYEFCAVTYARLTVSLLFSL